MVEFPKWLLHAGSNRFLNSDVWLHDTEREVVRRKEMAEKAKADNLIRNADDKADVSKKLCQMDYQYISQSDLGVSEFRKWWNDQGMADAPPHTFGMATMDQLGGMDSAALSRREQIDPWTSHGAQCAICRSALVKMKKVQSMSIFGAFLSVILGSKLQKTLLGLVGAGLCLFVYNFVKKFATVIEGNAYASGIADRSAAASAS